MDHSPICPPFGLQPDTIRTLLEPIARGTDVRLVSRVDGGLVNTTYRVVLGSGETLAVRFYARGDRSFETERDALARLGCTVPAPEVLMGRRAEGDSIPPILVYRWIEGITLNECRRLTSPVEFASLAEPLGRALAAVANVEFTDLGGESQRCEGATRSALGDLAVADERLRSGAARARLGAGLADSLRMQLDGLAESLDYNGERAALVHGDLRGRNILVQRTDSGSWRLSGLIDWEGAFSGSALWDVGALFRYAERYSFEFRARFERGYRGAGGTLRVGWWREARLLDATHLIAILNDDRDMPELFSECRELVAAIAEGR